MSDEQNNALGQYWQSANRAQREQLLAGMGDSRTAVRHIAAGRKGLSVAMAARIEVAMQGVDGLAPLTRLDMRSECANCPHRACGIVPAQDSAGGGQ